MFTHALLLLYSLWHLFSQNSLYIPWWRKTLACLFSSTPNTTRPSVVPFGMRVCSWINEWITLRRCFIFFWFLVVLPKYVQRFYLAFFCSFKNLLLLFVICLMLFAHLFFILFYFSTYIQLCCLLGIILLLNLNSVWKRRVGLFKSHTSCTECWQFFWIQAFRETIKYPSYLGR